MVQIRYDEQNLGGSHRDGDRWMGGGDISEKKRLHMVILTLGKGGVKYESQVCNFGYHKK